MHVIKVVWKDSRKERSYKQYVYRKIKIIRFGVGWIIDDPSDDNIYKSIHSAYNAIDALLGGEPQKVGGQKRTEQEIEIVGKKSKFKKDNETA